MDQIAGLDGGVRRGDEFIDSGELIGRPFAKVGFAERGDARGGGGFQFLLEAIAAALQVGKRRLEFVQSVERRIGQHGDGCLDAAVDGIEFLLDAGCIVGRFLPGQDRLHEGVDGLPDPIVVAEKDVLDLL